MNKIILIGRLTRDPELRYSAGDNSTAVAKYGLAVDRKKKNADDDKADFFSIVAFGKTAEFAEKYLRKGMKIGIVGHVLTGSYEKNEVRIPTFEVVAEEHTFCESKGSSQQNDGFMPVPDDIDDELPFV